MKAENFNVTIPDGKEKAEILIREVNNNVEQQLPVLEPDNVAISGSISAIAAFLEKRWNAADSQIDHCRTYVIVNRDKLFMQLVANETDKRNRKEVKGIIALSRQYNAFHINDGHTWAPEDLGQFFRINRTYFGSREENMKLVTLLKSFKAKINTDVERSIKDNGSVTDCYRQAVDSNLPPSFFISIPIFKNAQEEKIEVEVIAHVNGRDVELELISADAAAIEEEARDSLINDQLDAIREIAPEIPIIEQ